MRDEELQIQAAEQSQIDADILKVALLRYKNL
jgi:hypothetical protein